MKTTSVKHLYSKLLQSIWTSFVEFFCLHVSWRPTRRSACLTICLKNLYLISDHISPNKVKRQKMSKVWCLHCLNSIIAAVMSRHPRYHGEELHGCTSRASYHPQPDFFSDEKRWKQGIHYTQGLLTNDSGAILIFFCYEATKHEHAKMFTRTKNLHFGALAPIRQMNVQAS